MLFKLYVLVNYFIGIIGIYILAIIGNKLFNTTHPLYAFGNL
ncbi:MAG: hypothetical protein WAW59_00005 [Patescibacteria group bacterium]